MIDKENILGCFVSSMIGDTNGAVFREYLWGTDCVGDVLKKLKYKDYGIDIELILFQFYVNPIPYLLQSLKEIESYRKKEKSIGIPIIVTDENFFSKSDEQRYDFLKQSFFRKLDLLGEIVKRKKLDTNMDLLKSDLGELLK